ncbi:MAG TPA: DUF1801 domain-containing protein [Candidatus Dormibacteraeota bacterium]|nr:DUF1801 domain-containing protein [Candidatus Dormibacteraeota bacterium]
MTTTDPRVDAYLAARPSEQRELLEAVRRRVRMLAPEAVETIAYTMPAFRLRDHFLVSYAGWKRHCTVYPVGDDLLHKYADRLHGYGRSKSSLHFTKEQPLPDGLLEDVVRGRVAAIEAGEA